jgi:hypothetical protein
MRLAEYGVQPLEQARYYPAAVFRNWMRASV